MRSAATVRRLKMYRGRAVHDAKGKLVSQELQSKALPSTRIVPDRRWFGNTRVVGQKQLEEFRGEMAEKATDTYSVLLKERKLPLGLLADPEKGKKKRVHLLSTQPFDETFGPKRQRKRPRLAAEDYAALVADAEQKEEGYEENQQLAHTADRDAAGAQDDDGERDAAQEAMFTKGQSKRIWGELYKVVDSSDVIVQVLDVRDPMGTRSHHLETYLKKNCTHKHLILLLNKCDLVPSWVTKKWLHVLSREFPTLAFHASVTNPFGKGALLSLLRQFSRLRSDKQNVSVGFVGYPNVGKSSVINTLRTKQVCKTAPVPGETKVWQYITLTKRIFLIDCPGVVYHHTTDTDTDAVLKGVVRVANLDDAAYHVQEVLRRVKKQYITRAYKIRGWEDSGDFLEQLARQTGRLLKGAEPDINAAAKVVLNDWQRGRIPYFKMPPTLPGEEGDAPAEPAQKALSLAEGQDEQTRTEVIAITAKAAAATAKQAQRLVPTQAGFFDDDDVAGGDGEAGVEAEEGSAGGSDDGSEGEGEGVSDEEDGSDDDDDDDGPGPGPSGRAGDDGDGGGSDSDSDGYGEGGLSFDAVLAQLRGEGGAGGGGPAAAAAKRPKPAARRERKRGPKAGSKAAEAAEKAARKAKPKHHTLA